MQASGMLHSGTSEKGPGVHLSSAAPNSLGMWFEMLFEMCLKPAFPTPTMSRYVPLRPL